MNIPEIVDFPTPPFAEETAIIFLTSGMPRFCGRPRCRRGSSGGAPARGRPFREVRSARHGCGSQSMILTSGFSWLHNDLTVEKRRLLIISRLFRRCIVIVDVTEKPINLIGGR